MFFMYSNILMIKRQSGKYLKKKKNFLRFKKKFLVESQYFSKLSYEVKTPSIFHAFLLHLLDAPIKCFVFKKFYYR